MASNRKFNVPINLLSLASDPASADEGDIYYNTTDDRIRVYKNTTWVNLAYADDVGIVSTDFITFDTTPESVPATQGTISWDSGESGINLTANANVDIHLGQQNVVLVKNSTGSSIAKGKVVYINGAAGQRPTVALSDADTEATSSKTLGVTAETIADGAEGFVTTFGVQRGLNTLGLTEGASVWLSSTAGGFTTTIPAEPAHSVFIGYVVKANASSGEIFVNPQNGYELDELHGVSIEASGSLTDNEVLAYDTSSGLWKNQTSVEAGLIDTSSTAQTKTGNLTVPEIHATVKLVADTVGGDEGGEILLGIPATNTSIAGTGVTIDVYQNKLRFFEQGGTARGAYIDLTGASAGVGSNLLAGGSTVNSFSTISTPSGTSPVADSSTDTLTLTAGTGITITGDSATDSITIASTVTDTNTTYDLTSTGTTTASINLVPSSGGTDSVTITGSGATSVSHSAGAITISSTNTTYSAATSASLGLVELFSDTTQGTAANAVTSTASRTYGLQLNASNQGVVNVPWTDTTYSPGTALDLSGSTFNLDLSELTTSTADADGDFFVVVDAANAQYKLTKANINISGFNGDSLTLSGDIAVNGGDITTTSTTFSIPGVGPTSTMNFGTTAPDSGATKTINIGTGSSAGGATLNINLGVSAAITSTTTVNGALTLNQAAGNLKGTTSLYGAGYSGRNLQIIATSFNIGAATTSSLRYKNNIEAFAWDKDELLSLETKRFKYNREVQELGEDAPWHYGLIAEELSAIAGTEWMIDRDEEGRPDYIYWGERMPQVLFSLVQQLNEENKNLKARLDAAGL